MSCRKDKTIRVGDDPLAFRIAAGRGLNRWNRDVDAVGIEAGLPRQCAQVVTIAATGIEHDIVR